MNTLYQYRYWCLITNLINVALVNAWHVKRIVSGNNRTPFLDLVRSVEVGYIKKSNRSMQQRSLPHPFSTVRFDGTSHFLAKRDEQRRCQQCSSRPRTFCQKCDVTLCQKCFVAYHTA